MSPQLGWKAEYAYTTGMQAFIYGFPYIFNAKLRHDWVTQARDPAAHLRPAPMVRDLADVPAHPAVIEAKWECPGITPVT